MAIDPLGPPLKGDDWWVQISYIKNCCVDGVRSSCRTPSIPRTAGAEYLSRGIRGGPGDLGGLLII